MIKPKYFGYARKSPDEKKDMKTSISNQIELIEKFSKDQNIELVKIFIDPSISGSDRQRKQFLIMIKQLYKSDIEGVIVKDQDRFARDSSLMRDSLFDFQAYNKKLYSIMKGRFLSIDDFGDLVSAAVDDNYVLTQRKKTLILMQQKIDRGMPMCRNPFGYKYGKSKNWVIDKKASVIVANVISDYVNSVNYKETMRQNKITKGKYYRIIKNAQHGLYSGYIYYIRKHKNSSGKFARKEEVKYKGSHDPIISEELWQKCQLKDGVKNEKENS